MVPRSGGGCKYPLGPNLRKAWKIFALSSLAGIATGRPRRKSMEVYYDCWSRCQASRKGSSQPFPYLPIPRCE